MSATVTATMRSLNARGDMSCLRVVRGPHRKVSVILSGFCIERPADDHWLAPRHCLVAIGSLPR